MSPTRILKLSKLYRFRWVSDTIKNSSTNNRQERPFFSQPHAAVCHENACRKRQFSSKESPKCIPKSSSSSTRSSSLLQPATHPLDLFESDPILSPCSSVFTNSNAMLRLAHLFWSAVSHFLVVSRTAMAPLRRRRLRLLREDPD